MLTDRRTCRLGFGALLIALVAALPLAVAFAAEEQKPDKAAGPANDAVAAGAAGVAAAAPSIIAGRVTNEAGEALADVVVRVAIPARNMRLAGHEGFKPMQVKTDQLGEYKLELPATTKPTTASVDAVKRGYRSLAGMLMRGGDNRVVNILPGIVAQASFALEPASYVKGIVVDEHGAPIPDVKIHAGASFGNSSGGVEITASSADGSFEIFNFPSEPIFGGRPFKGYISFAHPNFIPNMIGDIYPMSTQEREAVKVVLSSGHTISGAVLDADERAVANVMVEAIDDTRHARKAILSDASGRFVLRGLVAGETTLRVHAMKLRQKIKTPLTLDRDYFNLELQLQPISLTVEPQVVDVLGMKLTDVTPELQSVYDLYFDKGVLILDPGQDHVRLKIGDLAEGNSFWMTGKQRVGSVRQFIERILAETADQDAEPYSCRVVYAHTSVDHVSNNTQYLSLTSDDLTQLREVLSRLTGK